MDNINIELVPKEGNDTVKLLAIYNNSVFGALFDVLDENNEIKTYTTPYIIRHYSIKFIKNGYLFDIEHWYGRYD